MTGASPGSPRRTEGFFAPPLPRVFAHRGLALEAPENSLLAFRRALEAGATHLETDVHASADGVAVIAHDPELSRVAGRAVRVADLRMDELRSIQLGGGERIPSLAEALDAFPGARFNIDVKVLEAIGPTAKAVREAGAIDRVLIASFSERCRRATAEALPGVASSASSPRIVRALLGTLPGLGRVLRGALRGVDAVQVPERRGPVRVVTPRFVRAAHDAGVEVHVWTVNDPDDMRRLLALGVDGIVTDRCDLAVPLLRPES